MLYNVHPVIFLCSLLYTAFSLLAGIYELLTVNAISKKFLGI